MIPQVDGGVASGRNLLGLGLSHFKSLRWAPAVWFEAGSVFVGDWKLLDGGRLVASGGFAGFPHALPVLISVILICDLLFNFIFFIKLLLKIVIFRNFVA